MTRAPGQPRVPLRERDRWEWSWRTGAAAPYDELQRFLTGHGLPAGNMSRAHDAAGTAVAGAVLLVGGGWPVSAAGGAASPCPQVPDVAVVVLEPDPSGPASGSAAEPAGAVGWTASWTPAEHAAAVEDVRAAIARGDLYQANVVGHRRGALVGAAGGLGAALATVPDAAYAGGISGEGWSVHSASPELLVEVADGRVTTRPIKGTVRRSADPAADLAARERLRTSAKDRAEHVMIVDLERNDLGAVARTGQVVVDELFEVRPLAGLWHAESTVRADLREGVGMAELLRAVFPGGSVTGAPKIAALQRIAAAEPVGRGPSMGAMGWFGADGRLTLALTIRTVAVVGDEVHLWAGGGVTWSSDPLGEVAEADAKAAPLIAALDPSRVS